MQLTSAACSVCRLKPFSPLPPPILLHRRCLDVVVTSCTSPRTSASSSSYSSAQQDVLAAIAESSERVLPCVRTYENDSVRLSLVGAVGFEQALTAAAADGGGAASEHLDAGVPAMVVETVLPGSVAEEQATVSTRLFLPARKVKEKAKKLKNSITDDMLAATTPSNIFAMTFKQVVMQQLWNFELVVFQPGAERDMDDLESPRKVPETFIIGSSNENAISVLAEAACKSILQITQQDYLKNGYGWSLNFFNWFNGPKGISSSDSSVVMYKLGEDEIVENAKSLLEHFLSAQQSTLQLPCSGKRGFGWTKAVHSKLKNIGGIEFCAWVHEYMPAYRLVINTDKLPDLRLEGWRQLEKNAQEVILTHSQMVGMANVLDMFYEDIYTLPDKELSCQMVVNPAILSNNKRHMAALKIFTAVLAGVIFVITMRAFGGLHLPLLRKEQLHAKKFTPVPPSETYEKCNDDLDNRKV
ncbi:hypothetical protein MLD38_039908 [Melastoma candidum]|uniref:Uncharacterized protein n=1 Tax=Melastoma candidum TaxID=119954 RepID=A0ACB9L4R7_9MYRT|nr:hypothetical protein MLD38_039908 [Melastoma candidum]